MSITGQCPGCGKPYAVDDKHTGRRMTCKQCGEVMRLVASEGGSKLRVECEHCGKGHWVSAENVGKKTVCKSCGEMFRIRTGEAATARKDSARATSRPDESSESLTPSNLDVFGLEEEPTAPRSQGAPPVEAASASHDGDDSAPLPSRLKPYKPLSAAQKKKIAKRADKIEKTKASTATVGISFGAVLAVALFGWRFYHRVARRIERATDRANAAQTAPAETDVADPKAAAAEMDQEVSTMIVQPTTAEAREWLDPVKYPNHAVMEMPTQTAREMVAGFYERGAEKVYVLEPDSVGDQWLTAQFAVRLPKDPAQRKQCLEWAAKHEGSASPAPDLGQKFLLITTD
jgi:ribosomal protein S27E